MASVHHRESTRIQQSEPLLATQHGTADSQLLLLNHNLDQVNLIEQKPVAEQKLAAASSNAIGHVKPGELPRQTMLSSLQPMKPDMLHVSKQPQSFPDRLAMIQRQKQIEESKTFARASVRALKVSNEIIELCLCCVFLLSKIFYRYRYRRHLQTWHSIKPLSIAEPLQNWQYTCVLSPFRERK